MKQYKIQLSQNSRHTEETEMRWVERKRIKSIAQIAFCERKIDDLVEEAKQLRYKAGAKNSKKLIIKMLVKTGELLNSQKDE